MAGSGAVTGSMHSTWRCVASSSLRVRGWCRAEDGERSETRRRGRMSRHKATARRRAGVQMGSFELCEGDERHRRSALVTESDEGSG